MISQFAEKKISTYNNVSRKIIFQNKCMHIYTYIIHFKLIQCYMPIISQLNKQIQRNKSNWMVARGGLGWGCKVTGEDGEKV